MAEPQRNQRSGANVAEFSVSELSAAIKRTLEGTFGHVRLRGEISGYRGPHSSGHCYFALKDDKAKIEAVIWRGVFSSLRFKPEEGMEVIATGKLSSFPGSSKYQIVIEALEPAGVGALMALLEERKKKFAAEGLFDEKRKKPRPFLPRVVGIVTSPTGAVIRDMLHGFDERFPTRVIVWPVRVQGETSAAEVAAAIRGFNAIEPDGPIPRPDVLIVARGGGSLEDLWGFNEEVVVRAAAESRIPLISAVGHETDWTLIDLVADARAPTPTKAAEWAVPKFADLVEQTEGLEVRGRIAVRRVLEGARTHLKAAGRGLPRAEDLVTLPRQRFDAIEKRLGRALTANSRAHAMQLARIGARLSSRLLTVRMQRAGDRLDALGRRALDALSRASGQRRARFVRISAGLTPRLLTVRLQRSGDRLDALGRRALDALSRSSGQRRSRFERTAGRLQPTLLVSRIARWRSQLDSEVKMLGSLSYQSVLKRGYAVVRDSEGRMLRSAAAVQPGVSLEIEFADGHVPAVAGGDRRVDPSAAQNPVAMSPRPATRTRGSGTSGQGSLF